MQEPKDKIPLFASWKSWYVFVLVVLGLFILLFIWFTNAFS